MSISYFILKIEIYGQTAGARGLCITHLFLVGGIIVAVAPATSDEAPDGMDHFEVKVCHTEVSGSPSCRWNLVGIIMPPATPSNIGGPNGMLIRHAEGAKVNAPVAFISGLSNGTYQVTVQALDGTSIVATGSVTLEILDIYWQTSYGSGGSTVNGSFISSVNYSIVGSDFSKIMDYIVYHSVNGSDHLPYPWLSEPAFEAIEPGWPERIYSYSAYANASAFSTTSARPEEA